MRLLHMRDCAEDAVRFCRGRARQDLDSDRMLSLALVRALEVIGEAASRIPAEFRRSHPGIPWADIVGTRNRFIHAYFEVDLDIVWSIVARDLPDLIKGLNEILRSLEPEGQP